MFTSVSVSPTSTPASSFKPFRLRPFFAKAFKFLLPPIIDATSISAVISPNIESCWRYCSFSWALYTSFFLPLGNVAILSFIFSNSVNAPSAFNLKGAVLYWLTTAVQAFLEPIIPPVAIVLTATSSKVEKSISLPNIILLLIVVRPSIVISSTSSPAWSLRVVYKRFLPAPQPLVKAASPSSLVAAVAVLPTILLAQPAVPKFNFPNPYATPNSIPPLTKAAVYLCPWVKSPDIIWFCKAILFSL